MENYNTCHSEKYELFLLTDECFIDKYAVLSMLVMKLNQFFACRIGINDGRVCLFPLECSNMEFLTSFMDGYINVFQD
ncbi:TPA: hypothetical protein JDY45_15480 [Citrobacter freundii]|jgi:hypothetical protein|nr:hypothetical protein AB180_04695 [Citrobacter freundii]QAR65070.1 hypothetical protein C3B53_10820 [Citrobacter sp. SL156]AKL55425.1 hypothetical protein AB183_05425 [Citrobacter freundii]AYL57043.1 hypothetical protein CUC48_10975 [Citrobacter freundii]KJC12099.1 hypothetical protein TN42_08390 [Citrobacter freundii]